MTIFSTGATINVNVPIEIDPSKPVAVADVATVASQGTVVINAVGNDTDADPGDQDYLNIARYTDPMSGNAVAGSLSVIGGKFYFTAADPSFDTGTHTVTFSYTTVDQWGSESNWSTVV